MRIESVKVRRLYLEVADQIKALIENKEIDTGARLPSERELAASFGVSRPTIREAMIALEIAGMIEIRSGSGIFALAPKGLPKQLADDVPGPFEILEARLLIEAETAALAAARITQEQIIQLEQALLIMESQETSELEIEAADERFHCIIAEATGNSALLSSVKWLWASRNNSEISTTFHRRVRELGVHPSIEDHRRILSALIKRDPVRARSAMQAHISDAIDEDFSALELDS